MSGELRVLFFASLADQLKCRSLAIPFPDSALSAADLRNTLIEQHGETWNALRSDQLRCAVNQEIVKMDHPLKPGDEIAFFLRSRVVDQGILMMRFFPIVLLALIGVLSISGCKNSSKKTPTTFDKPASLPAAFEDSFGETWTCINAEETSAVSGTARFTGLVDIWNADILHISLLELRENDIQLLATQCINNIGGPPIPFQIAYSEELIDPNARYVLSAVFFTRLDDGTYVASYRPDGFLEVINNDVTTKADLILKVP